MKFLSFKLWKEKKALKPSRVFKLNLWKDLDNAWQRTHQRNNFWYQNRIFRYGMVALAVVTFFVSSGVGVYAYNSSGVTEGTALYPIKKAIEKVEEKTKKTPEAKARFYLKQIDRREAEKRILEKKNKKEIQLYQLEEKIKNNENKLLEITEQLASSTLKDELKQRLEKHQLKLKEKIEKTEDKIETINLKLKEKINQEETISTSTPGRARNGERVEKFKKVSSFNS